jgi:hypothetical protein
VKFYVCFGKLKFQIPAKLERLEFLAKPMTQELEEASILQNEYPKQSPQKRKKSVNGGGNTWKDKI